jgi:hypothetical protein
MHFPGLLLYFVLFLVSLFFQFLPPPTNLDPLGNRPVCLVVRPTVHVHSSQFLLVNHQRISNKPICQPQIKIPSAALTNCTVLLLALLQRNISFSRRVGYHFCLQWHLALLSKGDFVNCTFYYHRCLVCRSLMLTVRYLFWRRNTEQSKSQGYPILAHAVFAEK